MAAVEEGSGGSVYAGPRVRVRRGRRAKLPGYRLTLIGSCIDDKQA